MVKVSDDLKTARARLAAPGVWAQYPTKGHHCLMTAADHLGDSYLMRALGTDFYLDAYHWNDAPGRTLDEVLAVYDKAIAIAEKEEAE